MTSIVERTLEKVMTEIAAVEEPKPSALAIETGDRILSLKEAAEVARKNPTTLSNWIADGRLKSHLVKSPSGPAQRRIRLKHLREAMAYKKDRKNRVSKNRGKGKTPPKITLSGESRAQEQRQEKPYSLDPVSYLYGHCETFIHIYARGTGLPVSELTSRVAELLLASTGG